MATTPLRPADALFGPVRRQVLGLLFANPDRDFYQLEVARFAGARLSAVQRELRRLEEAGLIHSHRRGRQVYYQADRGGPLFAELHGLALKTTGLADVLRAALAPLADHFPIAFIFGSLAAGTERPDSDVDLMMIGETARFDPTPALVEAEQRLWREISLTTMSPEEWAERLTGGDYFVTAVKAEPKIFILGDEEALATPGPELTPEP